MLTSSVTVMFPASTFVVSTRPIRCASSWGLSEEMSSPLLYTAFQRRKKTRERAQQRGFPDTVRAYQARELARMQGCLQVGSHRFALISDG